MKLDIGILSDTIAEYNSLITKLEETKTELEKAVSTLVERGWSGVAQRQYEINFKFTMDFYKSLQWTIDEMKSILEEDVKAKVGALKNRCEDFENCIIGSEKGNYSEENGVTVGIISLEYDNVPMIGEKTTDITFNLVQKERSKLNDISNTIKNDGWFSNGLKYCSFDISSEVSECATTIYKEEERITSFNESFGNYYNGIKNMENKVESKLKLITDDVAKDVTRDYYTPLEPNSNNHDWNRIKGLMQLDPDLISDDEYGKLIKIYTKMSDEEGTKSVELFIENSYIYIGANTDCLTEDMVDPCFKISPVYEEMSNRYKSMAQSMVEDAGSDFFSEPPSDETKKILKYISNSDILSGISNHASVIDAFDIVNVGQVKGPNITIGRLDMYNNDITHKYLGYNYDISLNTKGENIEFTIYGCNKKQDYTINKAIKSQLDLMKKDLMDVVEEVGSTYVKGKIKGEVKGAIKGVIKGVSGKAAGPIADVIVAAYDIEEKYTKAQGDNKKLEDAINNIDIGTYTGALAISTSVSTKKDGTVSIESSYVDLEEVKYRIWYFRTLGIPGDMSIQDYVTWYELDDGQIDIEKNREVLKDKYELDPVSKIKSLDELLQNSDVINNVIDPVDK